MIVEADGRRAITILNREEVDAGGSRKYVRDEMSAAATRAEFECCYRPSESATGYGGVARS